VPNAATSPLAGKRVVVTRAAQQSSDLFTRLSAAGAIPVSLPLVSFAPPQDYGPLDAALRQLQNFDWVIFTSANAVHAVESRAKALGIDLRHKAKAPQIAVVGPATRQEAEVAGFSVDSVAKTHLGVALAQELSDRLRRKAVFLPRSDRANPDLLAALRALDAKVTEIIAYRTLPSTDTEQRHATQILTQEADAVLFFSPTAVQHLGDLLGHDAFVGLQYRIVIAAIGPVTARALREIGVERLVQAADTTSAAVIDALRSHFATTPTQSQFIAGANPR
jgi:uroporphyrinogen-III synthase